MYDEIELVNRIEAGMSSTDIAVEMGISRGVVNRGAKRLGRVITGNKAPKIEVCRNSIENMKLGEAIEFLLNVIENYNKSQVAEEVIQVARHGFTPLQSQIIVILSSQSSVSRLCIYDRLYLTRATGDIPNIKIIDVMIHKIRQKFRLKNWGAVINTIHSFGYEMEREAGFLFPWETE